MITQIRKDCTGSILKSPLITLFLLFALCSSLFAQNGPPAGPNVRVWGSSGGPPDFDWQVNSNWTPTTGWPGGQSPAIGYRWARVDDTYTNYTSSPTQIGNEYTTCAGVSVETQSGLAARSIVTGDSTTADNVWLRTIPLQPVTTTGLTGNVEVYSGGISIAVFSPSSTNSGDLRIGGALNGYNTNSTPIITINQGSGNTLGGLEIYAFSTWSGVNTSSTYSANFSCNSISFLQGTLIAAQYYASTIYGNNLAVTGTFMPGVVDQFDASTAGALTVNELGGYGGLMVRQNAVLRMGANATLNTYSLTMWGSALGEDHSQSYTSTAPSAATRAYIDTWTNTPNTIAILGSMTTQYAMSFYNLRVKSPSTLTLGGNIYVNGDLTIDSGATLAAGANTIYVYGNFINNGTFSASSGQIVYIKQDSSHTVQGNTTFSRLAAGDGNSSGKYCNIASSASITVNVGLEVYANNNLNANSGTITIASGANMNLSNPGITWTPGTSAVIWQTTNALPTYNNGTNAQFYNLTIGTAGTVLPGATTTLTIQNNLTINSGSTFIGSNASSYQISVGGSWSDSGTFFVAGNVTTVTFTGAGPGVILTNETFYNLTIALGATTQLQGGKTITVSNAGALTINGTLQGSTATLVTPNMTLGGSGAFNAASSTVQWQGTTGNTIPLATFYNLTIQYNTSAATLGGSITVNNTLTIDTGANTQLDASTFNYGLTLKGNLTINSTNANPLVPRSGNVTFSGSGGQTISSSPISNPAIKFNTVTINETTSAGYVYLNYSATSTGLVTITTGALSVYNTGVLTLNSGIAVGDSSSTNGTTNAIFSPAAGSTITFASGKAATINYTGELLISASTPYPIFNTSSGQFALTIYGNSSVSGLTIQNINSAGAVMYFNGGTSPTANSNIVSFDNVNFNYAVPGLGVYAITFYAYNTAAFGGLTVNNTVFYTTGTGGTVFFDGSTGVSRTITMLNTSGSSGGALNGDANDNSSTDRGAGNIAQITWVDPIYWKSSSSSQVWDNANNWVKPDGTAAGSAPTSSSSVKIDSSPPFGGSVSPYPIISGTTTYSMSGIQLLNLGTLTISGSPTLNISGSFSIASGAAFTPSTTSTLNFNGTSGQTMPGKSGGQNYGNVQISNTSAGGVTTGGAVNIQGNLTIANGATFTTNAKVQIQGNWAMNGTGTHSAQTGSAVYFNGTSAQQMTSDQATKTFSFVDLEIDNSAGVSTDAGTRTLSISNSFTMASGGSFSAGNNNINIGGDWKFLTNGTFTANTSIITFNGANGQRIFTDAATATAVYTFNEIDLTNTSASGLKLALGNAIATLALNSHLKVGPGGQVSKFDATNTTVKVAGNWQMGSSASFTNTGSQVILNGTSAQTITNGSTQFSKLQINSTNTVTLVDALTAQQVYLNAGTLNANGKNITANYSLGTADRAVAIYGTLTLGTSTFIVTSNTNGNTSGSEYLYLSSGGTLTMTTGTIKFGIQTGGTNPSGLILGTFQALGTSSASTATINNNSPGSNPYTFTLTGATIYSINLQFLNYAAYGIYVNNPVSVSTSVGGVQTSNRLDYWLFRGRDSSIVSTAGGQDIYVGASSVSINYSCYNWNFETGPVGGGGPAYSISGRTFTNVTTLPTSTLTMYSWSTSRTGGYDPSQDGNDLTSPSNKITWIGNASWVGVADNQAGNGDAWSASANWTGAARGPNTNVTIYDVVNSGPNGGVSVWDCTGVNAAPAETKNLTINQTDVNGTDNGDGGKLCIDGTGSDTATNSVLNLNSTLIVNGDLTIQDGGILSVGIQQDGAVADATGVTNCLTHLTVNGNWNDNTVYVAGKAVQYYINGQKGFIQSRGNHASTQANSRLASGNATAYTVCFGGINKTYSGASAFYALWIGVPNFLGTAYADDGQTLNNEVRTLSSGSTLTILEGGVLYSDIGTKLQGGSNVTQAIIYFKGNYSTGLYANWLNEGTPANWDPGNCVVKWQNGNTLPNNQPSYPRSCFYDVEVGNGTNNYTVTLTRALVVYDNLTIKAGTTLKTNGFSITVGGNLTVESGANIIFNPWDSITFNSFTQATQTVNAPQTQFQRVVLNKTGASLTLQLANTMDVYSQFTITNNETLNTSTYQFTQRDQCVYNNGVLSGSGTYLIAEGAATAAYAVPFTNFYNLTIAGIAGSTVRLRGNTTVTNNMTIQSGTFNVQDFSSGIWNLNVGGNWTYSGGTFTPSTGTVTFNGSSGTQNINNPTTFYNLNIADSGATTYYNGAWSSISYLTVSGTLTMTSGTLDLGQGRTGTMAHQVSGSALPSVSVSGGTLKLNTSSLIASNTGGGVYISGGTISATSAGTSYYALGVGGAFQMTAGTLDATGVSAEMYVQSNWKISGGTFNLGTSRVTLSGTSAANITTLGTTSGDFYNLDLNATAAKTLVGTSYFANNLTFDSGETGTLAGAVNIYVTGNWNDVPGGKFTSTGSTVYFNGSAAQTISAETFNNLAVSNSSSSVDVTANGNINTTNLTVTSGNFNMGANTVTVGGAAFPSVYVQSGQIKISTGKLNPNVSGGGVNNAGTITFSGAGTLDSTGNITNTGTINSSGQSALIYTQGNWAQSGTFNVGTSLVRFYGTANSTVTTPGASSDFYDILIDKGSNAIVSVGSSSTVNVADNLRTFQGEFDTSTGAVNVTGNITKEILSAVAKVYVGSQSSAVTGTLNLTGNISATTGAIGLYFSVSPATSLMTFTGTTFAPTTLNAGNGTIRFNNTSTGQTIPNGYTYNNIDIANGTTVTVTPNGSLTMNGTLKVGVASVASGTMGLSTYTGHTATNLRLENSGTLSLSSGMITVSGIVNDAAGAGATINFNTGTLASTSTTNGNFNSTNTTLNFNGTAGALWIYATPTFGTVSAGNGTISYRGGNATQTAPLISYYTLEVNKSAGGVYTSGSLTASSGISVVSGGFDPQNNVTTAAFNMTGGGLYLNEVANLTMNVSGNWSKTGGTFTAGSSSLVYFNGTTQSVSITGANQFYNFRVANGSATTFTNSNVLNVAGQMDVYGSLYLQQSDHTVAGATNVWGNGTLDLTGTASNQLCDLTANGNLTVQTSGTLNLRNASALYAANGAGIVVHGTLFTPAGAAVKPAIEWATVGQRFNFWTDGIINASGLYFSGARSDAISKGFEIRAGATLQTLNNVDFRNVDNNGGSGGVHLNLLLTQSAPNNYNFTISNPTFDTSYFATAPATATATYAIVADSPTNPGQPTWSGTITMSNATLSSGMQIDKTFGDNNDYDGRTTPKSDTPSAGQYILVWSQAFIWTGGTDTNWSNTANWQGNTLPPTDVNTATRDTIIKGTAAFFPILNQEAYVKSLTIEDVAQLNLGAGNNIYISGSTFSVQGTTASSGIYFATGQTPGKIVMSGSTQSISKSNSASLFQIGKLIINSTTQTTVSNSINVGTSGYAAALDITQGSMVVASGATVAVYQNVTIFSGGTLDLSASGSTLVAYGSVANNAGSTITFGASGTGTLNIIPQNSGATFTSGGTFTAGNGTVQVTGTLTLPVVTFYNLNLIGASSAYTCTLGGTTTCGGSVSIGSSTTLDVSASNYGLNVGGNWTKNGTFNQQSGTVTFNGSSGTQNINNPTTFYNLTIADAGATTYYNGAWSSTSYLTVQGKLTVSSGTLDLGQGRTGSMAHQVTYNTSPSVEVSGGTLKTNTSELLATGSSAGLTIDGGTVSMTSVVATTYYALYIYGQVQMTSGTLDSTGASAQVYVAGAWSVSGTGTFNIGTSDVTFAGSTAQSITTKGTTSGDFYNVDIGTGSGAVGVKTLGGTTYIANNLTMDGGAGANVLAGGVNIYVAGNWNDVPGNSFNNAGTAVYFNGSSAQTISAESFVKMIVNKSGGTATTNGALTVNTLLLVQAGTLDLATYTHTASGTSFPSVQVTGGTLKFSTATLNVSGAGGGVDITGGTADMTGAATMNIKNTTTPGDFKLEGGTLSMSSSAAALVYGNWTFSSGTYNVGGTVTFAPLASTTKTISNTSGATTDFQNVIINGSGITQLSNDVIISGNLTLTAGILNAGGAVNIYVAGNWSEAGSVFSNASTTVYFNGSSGTQSVQAETFNAVRIKNTGISVTASGRLYMASLTFDTGVLDLGTSITAPAHVVTGAVNISPASGTSNLKFNTSAMTMYSNLTIGNNGTLTMTTNNATNPLDIYGDFTMNSGGTLNLGTTNTAAVTARGNWTQNGGTINVANTTLSMTGSSKTITIPSGSYPASPNFYNLTTAGSVTAAAGIYVFNNLVVNAAASFTANSGSTGVTHYINGTATVNAAASGAGGYFNLNNSALVFTAAYSSYTNVLLVNSNTSNGQFVMYAASGIYLSNYDKMDINGSIGVYANGGTAARITHNGTADRYRIIVNGPFYLDNMNMQYYDANGFELGDETASNILNLSTAGVAYMNTVNFKQAYAVGTAAYHNSIMGNVTGSMTWNSCSWDNTFNLGTGHNIQARQYVSPNTSMPTITLANVVAAGGEGQPYDIEANDSPDHLVWVITTTWNGAGSPGTAWGVPGNWSNGVPTSVSNAVIPNSTGTGNMPLIDSTTIAQCFNLTLNSGSGAALTVKTTLGIYGALTISGGTMTVNLGSGSNHNGDNLYVGGNITTVSSGWTNSAKGASGGGIILNGSSQQQIQNSMSVYQLEISNSAIINNGVTLTVTGAPSSGNSFSIDSGQTFTMNGNGGTAPQLQFANGASLSASGTFQTTYTASNPVPIVTNNGSGTFSFTLNGGVDITGLAFSYGNASGMYANTLASFTNFSNIYFNNALSTGQHLTINQTGGRLNAPTVFFDTTSSGTKNARTGTYNVSANDASGNFRAIFIYSNDSSTSGARYQGGNASSNNGTAQAIWVDNATVIAGADSANGGIQGLLFHGNAYSYGLMRSTTNDVVVQLNRTTYSNSTYVVAAATYGHIVGRPIVLEIGWVNYSGGTDNVFFGTTKGYLFRLGQDLSVYSNYPNNTLYRADGSVLDTLTAITSPVISDYVWGGNSLLFAGISASNAYYFCGVYINNFYATNFSFPRFGASLYSNIVSEPSIDVLNIGTNSKFVFIGALYDGTKGHIWRIGMTDASQDVDYSGASPPDSDVKSPVNEYAGFLTVASTDTRNGGGSGTPRVYLIKSGLSGSMPIYSSPDWPVAANYGVEYGVDNDYGGTGGTLGGIVAYGTKGGYFSVRPFGFTNSFGNETYYNGFPTVQIDGGSAITTYPVRDVCSTIHNGSSVYTSWVYFFGTANGKVYKVEYGNKEGLSSGLGGTADITGHDGWYIYSNSANINNATSTPTPFLNIGTGDAISGLSFNGSELYITTANGEVYNVNSGD